MTWLSLKYQGIEHTIEPLLNGQWHYARYKDGFVLGPKKLLKNSREAAGQAKLLADVTDKKWTIHL